MHLVGRKPAKYILYLVAMAIHQTQQWPRPYEMYWQIRTFDCIILDNKRIYLHLEGSDDKLW